MFKLSFETWVKFVFEGAALILLLILDSLLRTTPYLVLNS